MKILDVNAGNVDELGFFCYMSKRKSVGYASKLAWVKERFAEGLRIRLLALPDRGFIEYMPGEKAWRAIQADGWMVIHCLWVVGKSRKQGHAKALLAACEEDARQAGKAGVAIVTSEKTWMIDRKFFDKQGYICVDNAEPSFSLMAKTFRDDAPLPSFPRDWDRKSAKWRTGLTVIHTGQCPYIEDAAQTAVNASEKAGVPCKVAEITSREQLMEQSPSPFGVFGIVHYGCLLSYHYQLEKDLLPLLKSE